MGASEAEIITEFGEPTVKEGQRRIYKSLGLVFEMSRRTSTVAAIYTGSFPLLTTEGAEGFTGKTEQGIRIGSTTAEVIAAYGQGGVSQLNDHQILNYRGLGLQVALRNEKVVGFLIKQPW